MAADMAVELKKQNVACVSLWPGPVKTELIQELVLDKAAESEKVIFEDEMTWNEKTFHSVIVFILGALLVTKTRPSCFDLSCSSDLTLRMLINQHASLTMNLIEEKLL